jgi:hypothetical protein
MRPLLALCAAAFLSAFLAGCMPASGPEPTNPAPPMSGPALWLAQDADSRVWLLGTVHVLPKTLTWRSPAIESALAEADLLIMEIDPAAGQDPAFAARFDAAGRNPPGVALSSLLSAEDRARLARAAEKAALDPASLEAYRPWMAALRLSYAALAQRGVTAEAGVEMVLTAQARRRGLPIQALETPDQQIGFFAGLTPQVALAAFQQTLRDIERGDDTLELIDQLWATGQAEKLGAALLPDFKAPGEQFYRVFLADRNADWADQIARLMAGQGDVFVAVGAAHMAGPDGLPALLRARGIAVEGCTRRPNNGPLRRRLLTVRGGPKTSHIYGRQPAGRGRRRRDEGHGRLRIRSPFRGGRGREPARVGAALRD